MDAISLSKKSRITPLSGANFHSLNLFLSDKVLYFDLSFICKDTNLPIIPKVTIAFAAVSKNILLPINFDLIMVFPELGLSISVTYKSYLVNIK